ncbi:MAG TPA: T9SS type A sorting domain-containing protein [Flavobacterium sp.]|nr:T9SS type A sorting domain-containing protein [Flavobacterium sp.]
MKQHYPFLLAALFLLCGSARAGIVYTDIPDGAPTGLDFNGDGVKEFTISSDPGCVANYITYTAPSNVYSPGASSWDTAAALASGFSIGPSGNWYGFVDCTVNGFGPNTSFPLNADRYIGFRINYNGNLHYGWARVYMTGGNGSYSVTWKDYAYESTPAMAISAGATGLGLPDTSSNVFTLYPNPTSGSLFISQTGQPDTAFRYAILDLNGRTVAEGQADPGTSIPVALLPQGVYLFRMGEAIRRFVRK